MDNSFSLGALFSRKFASLSEIRVCVCVCVYIYIYVSFPGSASGKESACQYRRCKRHKFDPWIGKIPGAGNGNPLQYSCLENPMDSEPDGLQSMGLQRVGRD